MYFGGSLNNQQVFGGQSFDLNPIENLFAIFKKKVALKLPSNKEELINAINYVWRNEIGHKYIESLVKSMPDRISAIIKSRGYHSKY